jgi:hypothetical protein
MNSSLFTIRLSRIVRAIKSRRMKRAGNVARIEKMTNSYIFVEKPEGTRPLG